MVIKTLDSLVNAFPNETSILFSEIFIGDSKVDLVQNPHKIVDIAGTRIFGYFAGVSFQSLYLGYIIGTMTNNTLFGTSAGLTNAGTSVLLKVLKYI